jgi:hypothetical protein
MGAGYLQIQISVRYEIEILQRIRYAEPE